MLRKLALFASVAALPIIAQQMQPPKTTLKVGDAAPDFSLRGTDGKTYKLSEQKGHTVVLAFFPAAFTGG
jgi:peroxiredoxin Q/BCP